MKYLIFVVMLLPKLCMAQTVTTNTKIHSTKAVEQLNNAPEVKAITSLQIGDVVPDVVLKNILNYKTTNATLNSFKGKLVILDFFATWCGSCIRELPKLDSLQKNFRDSLQVLVTSYQPRSTIQEFFGRNKKARSVSLPFLTSDSTLSRLFPHRMLPHQVWINPQGVVIAITYPQYATAQNIKLALLNELPTLPLKKDLLDFDKRKPLLYNDNGGTEESLLQRSVFTKYLEGVSSRTGITKTNGTKRLYFINFSSISLYTSATGWRNNNRIILQVNDTSAYIDNGLNDYEWSKANYYSYELTLQDTATNKHINATMLSDLNRYLGINGRIEKAKVKCWAMVAVPAKPNSNTASKVSIDSAEKYTASVTNKPLSELLHLLNIQVPTKPLRPIIVDETGYTGLVSITIKSSPFDIASLREELKLFGFDLVPVERELDMLILTEKDFKQPPGP